MKLPHALLLMVMFEPAAQRITGDCEIERSRLEYIHILAINYIIAIYIAYRHGVVKIV
jgi:hypothetical protein